MTTLPHIIVFIMLLCTRALNFCRSSVPGIVMKGTASRSPYTSQKGHTFTSSWDIQPKQREGSGGTAFVASGDMKGNNFVRLFVSNIPLDVTWKELKDHFALCGGKYVSLSEDPVTKQPRGCGLISFDSMELAEKATKTMDGSVLKGSSLNVRFDRKAVNSAPVQPKYVLDTKAASEESVAVTKLKYAKSSRRSTSSLRKLIRESKAATTPHHPSSSQQRVGTHGQQKPNSH